MQWLNILVQISPTPRLLSSLQSISVSLARAVEAESRDPLFHLKHVMIDTVGNMVILIKSSLHFELLQFYKCNTLLSFKNLNAL